jgi:hypothetical protein
MPLVFASFLTGGAIFLQVARLFPSFQVAPPTLLMYHRFYD